MKATGVPSRESPVLNVSGVTAIPMLADSDRSRSVRHTAMSAFKSLTQRVKLKSRISDQVRLRLELEGTPFGSSRPAAMMVSSLIPPVSSQIGVPRMRRRLLRAPDRQPGRYGALIRAPRRERLRPSSPAPPGVAHTLPRVAVRASATTRLRTCRLEKVSSP